MEITERNLERLITCSILLEEACRNNSMALRAVKLMREELDEIEISGSRLLKELQNDMLQLEQAERPLRCVAAAARPCRATRLDRENGGESASAPADHTPPGAARSDGSDRSDRSDKQCGTTPVREYGRELIAQGAGARDVIRNTMEYFGLSQHEFARMIGVNQGSISRFLHHGGRRAAVMAGMAGFFGDDHKGMED